MICYLFANLIFNFIIIHDCFKFVQCIQKGTNQMYVLLSVKVFRCYLYFKNNITHKGHSVKFDSKIDTKSATKIVP